MLKVVYAQNRITNLVFRNRLVIVFYSLFMLASCKQGGTTLKGTLTPHKGGETLTFYAIPVNPDVFHTDKIPIDSCIVAPDGTFSFKWPEWKTGFFDLALNGEIIAANYFLPEGAHLNLELNVAQSPAKLIRSDNDPYNNFIQHFSDSFYRNPSVKHYYYVESNFLLAPDYARYIDGRHRQQLDYAASVLNDTTLDAVFRTWLRCEIDFQWANDKTAFLWKKWIRNEEVPLDSSYYNFIHQLDINNPSYVISAAYVRFLQLYIRELHRQLPVEQQKKDAAWRKMEIALRLTRGPARSIALRHILDNEWSNVNTLGALDENAYHQTEILAQKMAEITGDKGFIRYIEQKK